MSELKPGSIFRHRDGSLGVFTSVHTPPHLIRILWVIDTVDKNEISETTEDLQGPAITAVEVPA